MKQEKILIVDDSEMNRSILADMLGEDYIIIEAEDGIEAVSKLQKQNTSIDLVLLDIVMPQLDGFGVLDIMNRNHWIDDIPVIMVSAEREVAQVERAYELGATDFIMRPFDASIVRHRVVNTLLLYAKQKRLIGMVEEQLYENEKNNRVMIDILSHIVEFRNGESGLHVLHVRAITNFLLRKLVEFSDCYPLTEEQIALITTGSALHDIGKIGIDEQVLNKPGKLTDEEFEVIKTHCMIGARMLEGLSFHQDDPLVRTAYEICRWHHERYDGRGYPDGLRGEEIPISAQVVALADVYDALTSARVYKAAYDHDTAVQMIVDGQCGSFSPLLIACLQKYADELCEKLETDMEETTSRNDMGRFAKMILKNEGVSISERTLRLLDYERMKNNFFSDLTEEIQFEYTKDSDILTVSTWGAKKLGISEITLNCHNNDKVLGIIGEMTFKGLARRLRNTTPEHPEIDCEIKLNCQGQIRWHRVVARAVWSEDEPSQYEGALGKAIDIHRTHTEMEVLKKKADRDPLTGLLNINSAKFQIKNRLMDRPGPDYMMVILDLDHFKDINDTYGHRFGNQVLQQVATSLSENLRRGDICARIGGDEFLIFMKAGGSPVLRDRMINRIYAALSVSVEECPVSVSMGIASTADTGCDYDEAFVAADRALYFAKENGRGRYCYYDESMRDMLQPADKPTAVKYLK